jgi:membrane-bound lytic murein transglycosylase B
MVIAFVVGFIIGLVFGSTGIKKWLLGKPAQAEVISSGTFTADIDYREQLVLQSAKDDEWNDTELAKLKRLFSDPRAAFLPDVLNRNATHVETKEQYRPHFNKESVIRIKSFHRKHLAVLKKGADKYGVPAEIITAILKVETDLGERVGERSVFNTFWSLSLGDNQTIQLEVNASDSSHHIKKMIRRAKWARKELRNLLYVVEENRKDPFKMLGSWAGAFGLSQFIPSSYRSYARDGDGDEIIDLENLADAASSIANYLKQNGWKSSHSLNQKKKVIMRYNQSSEYAEAVLSIADNI